MEPDERFALLVNGPALFNAVVTGIELDIFGHLARAKSATASELAQFSGLGDHQMRVLLLCLCSSGLVDRRDGQYENSDLAQEFIGTDGPDSWQHILLGWQRIYYPAFAHSTEALRAGSNTALEEYPGTEPTLYQRLSHDPEREAVLHRSMAAFTLQSLPGLVNDPRWAAVQRLLDVGGGDGTTSRHLLERHPQLTATVFDLPSVVELARSSTPEHLVRRFHAVDGDLFADPFPSDADAVLFSHVLEVFSLEQIGRLLAKAHKALPVGGRVFIYGFNAPDQEDNGPYAARLSLYLNILATGQGMAYPARDYAVCLSKTGFSDVETIPGPYEHGLVVGTKVG